MGDERAAVEKSVCKYSMHYCISAWLREVPKYILNVSRGEARRAAKMLRGSEAIYLVKCNSGIGTENLNERVGGQRDRIPLNWT